jgi:hypothetical protein
MRAGDQRTLTLFRVPGGAGDGALIAWVVLAPVIAVVLVVALRARAGAAQPSRDANRLPAVKAGAR